MPKKKSPRALKRKNQNLKNELNRVEQENETMSLSLSKHDHKHIHNVTVSALPSPEDYEAYPDNIKELILLRIKTDIENDKKLIKLEENEQTIRDKETSGEISLKTRGQYFAMFSLVLLSSLSIYFAEKEAFKIAAAIISVTVVGSISAFVGFRRQKRDGDK